MAVTQAEVEAAALGLPAEARARLAERLLASLEDDPGVTTASLDEARRRDAELTARRVAEVPSEEVFAKARRTQLGELLKLPSAERLALIEKLWDSLALTPAAIAVPEAHLRELDRRLDYPATGPSLSPDQLTERLRRQP